jgi:hypothetical protein
MSIDPLKRIPKREEQLKTEPKNHKGIKLYDIDSAIAEHMIDTVMPTIEVMGEKVKVPVIYGNPERWKAIKKDGFLRDRNGQVQIPVCVFKRNSVARDDTGAISMNRNLFYTAVSGYSKKHKYDRFSQMTSARRPVELYNVTIPDYVTITYEVNVWTDFTEHMNKIVEAFQYATDEYWGDKNGFKFRVKIDSFDNTTEVGEGTQRIVRTTFTMLVDAYLLPEKFDNESTTLKEISPKKIVWAGETDLTGKNFNLSKQSLYTEYSDVIDFMSIRSSQEAVFVDADTIKLTNVELPKLPPELVGSFDTDQWFRVYVNGVLIPSTKYSYTGSYGTNEIYFNFNTGSLQVGGTYPNDLIATTSDLGYILESSDEIGITGKFIEL